jgi:hypothetical protein
MILFPEVQEKARSHIEAVCGDRLPEMTDYDNLPYLRAVMKETVRWLPTAVLGAVVMDSYISFPYYAKSYAIAPRCHPRRLLHGTYYSRCRQNSTHRYAYRAT